MLLKSLPVPRAKWVKHELAQIIFKVGQVTDPVIGTLCRNYLAQKASQPGNHLPNQKSGRTQQLFNTVKED